MNREKQTFSPALLTVVLGAVCLLARCPAAEPAAKAAPEAPKTLEAQLEYLEGALSEGLRTQDWKMLELACTGYKASGLKDKDLELSITRAERDAALDVLRAYTGLGTGHIAPFGLGARTILGDSAAHTKLHNWGFDDLPEVKVPDQALYQSQPAEADKQMRAYQSYQQDLTRQENALLTLALLKEPGVLDRVFARLNSKEGHKGYSAGMLYNGDTLILAALAADPEQGYKKLLALASDEKSDSASTTLVLSSLVGLKAYAKVNGEAKFSLRSDLAAKLPADVYTQIAKPFVALLTRWKPDDKQQGFDMSLNSLLNITYQLPKGTLDHDALTTLVSLKDKVNDQQGWMKQQIDQVLKMQGYDPNTAQKPPAPPKDF